MPSVWRRKRYKKYDECFRWEHTFGEYFSERTDKNKGLDFDTKLAALKVSPSIVSLVSRSGQKIISTCSGTIIECEEEKESNGTFINTILTSASLIRSPFDKPALADNMKVDVYLSDGELFEGHVSAFDYHHNLAVITIRSHAPLPTAILRHFDDSLPLNQSALWGPRHKVDDLSSFQLRRLVDKAVDSNLFKLCPGDRVVALGRHYKSYVLMAAPGEFSVDWCNFDCKELSRANCKISKSGIGGPLINYEGEVIGINFYHARYTPFLPINIASKCLEHLKKHGRVRQPWLGMVVINLYAASVAKLEKIIQKFPKICKGVIVEEVKSGSPAYSAGIRPDDVIIQCDGNFVGCSSEFVGIMWDKAGESVEVVMLRASIGASLNLTLVADVINSLDEYNRWPVPKENLVSCSSIRVMELE